MPKIRVTFKTPDALDEPCKEAGKATAEEVTDRDRLELLDDRGFLSREHAEALDEDRERLTEYWTKFYKESLSKWVKYGEYVTIEFDTLAGTATVVPAGG